jgi:hypothetical protein
MDNLGAIAGPLLVLGLVAPFSYPGLLHSWPGKSGSPFASNGCLLVS